ncbi:hypothetical protein BMR03_01170 [Methylococcaceae bacterium HT2]|nr:hypothetical protein BMR03_01170 [Methylococcaceae bacterium HT2]
MVAYNQNSRPVPVFHAFPALEEGSTLAGYAALIAGHGLLVPAPPDYLCAIGTKHKRYEKGRWRIFTPRHKPNDSLHNHLTFALKHEGIDLAVLKALLSRLSLKLLSILFVQNQQALIAEDSGFCTSGYAVMNSISRMQRKVTS